MRSAKFYGVVAGCVTTYFIFLISLGRPDFGKSAIRKLSGSSQPTRQHGPSMGHSQAQAPTMSFVPWEFDYRKHGRNYGLSESQCETAFPGLYREVDRAMSYRRSGAGNVTLEDLDVGWRGDGIVRALIQDNQLYIIDAHGVWDHNHRPRALATLHSLHRAITAYGGVLPNIEFTMVDHDWPLSGKGNQTTWAYTRLEQQESLWLMPDFGFWGWPDVGMRSYSELQTILEYDEDDFLDKIPKLVWRGSLAVGSGDVRHGLMEHSKDQPWSDVQTIDWSNKSNIAERLLPMEDHCGYMFTAQTEGNTYSGRLKYLLNCHSILFSHPLTWIEHYHHFLKSSGPEQNYVEVKRDYSDLPSKMKTLLHPSNLVNAEAIADSSRETFRRRYLTPAAEACYWRALIRGWATVQGFEPKLWIDGVEEVDWRGGGKRSKRKPRGTPFESYAIMEETEWEIPAKARKICIAT